MKKHSLISLYFNKSIISAILFLSAPAFAQDYESLTAKAKVPADIERLIALRNELTSPSWKPDVSFSVEGVNYALPGSVRKFCTPGKSLKVEINYTMNDLRGNSPTIYQYRGPSTGCYPTGEGLIYESAYRFWVGGVTTPAQLELQKEKGGTYVTDRFIPRPLLPEAKGLGLNGNSADSIDIARAFSPNYVTSVDKYGYVTRNMTKGQGARVDIGDINKDGVVIIEDLELAKSALNNIQWEKLNWLAPASRKAILWPDGRAFAGTYDRIYANTDRLIGDVYLPGGISLRGDFYTSDFASFMLPGSISKIWTFSKAPDFVKSLFINHPSYSKLGEPGIYSIPIQKLPGDVETFGFSTPEDLIDKTLYLKPWKVRELFSPWPKYGEARSPTVIKGWPAYPVILELDELPQIARGATTYSQLMAPKWSPIHEIAATQVDKTYLLCGARSGPARFKFEPTRSNGLIEARVSDMACKNGRTEGMLLYASGSAWIGELGPDSKALTPSAVGKGVQLEPSKGNFIVVDLDKAEGHWRAYGDRHGQMIVTLEDRGLFSTRSFGGDYYTYVRTISDGPVFTRLYIPEIGYFNGMSDRENGFIFGGADFTKTDRGNSEGYGVRLSKNGVGYFTTFFDIEGKFSVTGYTSLNADPFMVHVPLGHSQQTTFEKQLAKSQSGEIPIRQPVDAGHLLMAGFSDLPLRFETYTDTSLGPPGVYLFNGRYSPSEYLPSAQYVVPDINTLARVTDPSVYKKSQWSQAEIDNMYASLDKQGEAYWSRVLSVNEIYNQEQYANYNKSKNSQIAEEREEARKRAERQANLIREINGAFGYLAQRAEQSAYEMQESQAQAFAAQNGTRYVQGLSPQQKRDLAASRSRASKKYIAQKNRPAPSYDAEASKIDEIESQQFKAKAEVEKLKAEAANAKDDPEAAQKLLKEAEAKEADAEALAAERSRLEQELEDKKASGLKQQEENDRLEQEKEEKKKEQEEKDRIKKEAEDKKRAQAQKEDNRYNAQGYGNFSIIALPEIVPTGSPGSGTLSSVTNSVGRCDATRVTVNYNFTNFMGGPGKNASLSWQGEEGCKPGTWLKVWFEVTAHGGAKGYVGIEVDPVMAGQGTGSNMGGIGEWSALLCGFEGTRQSSCMSEDAAKRIWSNGRVTGFVITWSR